MEAITKNMIVNLCKINGILGLVLSEQQNIKFKAMMTKQYYQWILLYLNGQKKSKNLNDSCSFNYLIKLSVLSF